MALSAEWLQLILLVLIVETQDYRISWYDGDFSRLPAVSLFFNTVVVGRLKVATMQAVVKERLKDAL